MYSDLTDTVKRLESQGYEINDPWDVVHIFETKVAAYAGSKYAVSLDSCTNALFLCLNYLRAGNEITIPKKTYLSVPGANINSGRKVVFEDLEWEGVYQLKPTNIYDGATRFRRGMYIPGSYQCLSFHKKKILSIGKGGMILTDDLEAYNWFKVARYEGRHTDVPYDEDTFDMIGWNMYMPPEQAAYGIEMFESLPDFNEDCGSSRKYKDLSVFPIFK